jgi:hypothetical protein
VVHKALNWILGVLISPGASRSSSLPGFLEASDGSGEVDVLEVFSRNGDLRTPVDVVVAAEDIARRCAVVCGTVVDRALHEGETDEVQTRRSFETSTSTIYGAGRSIRPATPVEAIWGTV